MKKVFQTILFIASVSFVLQACRPDSYKELGVARENISSLAGTWKLTKVLQTDEDAARKGFPYQALDVTSFFAYTDFKFTLNTNGNTPTTFTTVPGNSPKIIRLLNGNWTADDPVFPKVLTLTNGTQSTKITLGSYPSANNPILKIRVERRDSTTDKLLISYSYEFSKQ